MCLGVAQENTGMRSGLKFIVMGLRDPWVTCTSKNSEEKIVRLFVGEHLAGGFVGYYFGWHSVYEEGGGKHYCWPILWWYVSCMKEGSGGVQNMPMFAFDKAILFWSVRA